MSYLFKDDELQKHLNSAFNNILSGLCKEKYITAKQRDEIGANYSIIIESSSWLPKCLSDWIGLKDDKVHYRLVKAIGRYKATKCE